MKYQYQYMWRFHAVHTSQAECLFLSGRRSVDSVRQRLLHELRRGFRPTREEAELVGGLPNKHLQAVDDLIEIGV
jgi:hypothetical protein